MSGLDRKVFTRGESMITSRSLTATRRIGHSHEQPALIVVSTHR